MIARHATELARPALLALGGSLAIAASAQIQVPMQPVPMTMQSLVVLLVGIAYGPRLGAATVLLYLAQGLIGLPVFAGFRAGPAALAGWLAAQGWARGALRTAATLLAGHAVLFAFGTTWLGLLIGFDRAVALGLLPFLPGTAVKTALGVALLVALREVRRA